MKIKQFLTKGVLFLFILCFGFTAVYVPQHYKHTAGTVLAAPAQEGTQQVNTANNILTRIEMGINNALTTTIANVTSLQWWYDQVLDKLGWALAKAILSAIMRDIVRWINSGFQGSPAFIQDLGGFLTDVADQAAGRFIQEVGGPLSIVCSPFRLNIQIALAVSYNRTRDRNARRCTLTGALQNIQNFIGGDFNQGGWGSWLQITQRPGYYTQPGALLEASTEMGIRITNSQGRQVTLGNWGMGFLSSKVCDDPQSPTGAPTAAGTPGASQGTQAAAEGRNCRIVTPGQVISSQINETLQLGNRTLIEADEINEVIGAFMQQMATQAITSARGLLGTGGGGGRYSNPNFNVDLYRSSDSAVDYTQARSTINQSLSATLNYRDLAERIINRYENSYTTNPTIEARAVAAYNEARALLPGLQTNVISLQSILADFDGATDNNTRATALNSYTRIASSLPIQDTVSAQAIRWDNALSGMLTRTSETVDRRAMVEQVALEREYRNLINAVTEKYVATPSPSGAETNAYNRAREALPTVQANIITVQDLIQRYDNGETNEALDEYRSLRSDLSTETEVDRARVDWEIIFGTLL